MGWVRLEIPEDNEAAALARDYAKKARFLVDEGLGQTVAEVIKDLGWNTVYAKEVGLGGHSDEEIFAYAWQEKRTILTHDKDFWDDQRFPFHRSPGLVILPDVDQSLLELAIANTLNLLGTMARLYFGSKVKMASDGSFVIRAFDKAAGRHTIDRYRFTRHGAEQWVDD